MKIMTFNTQHCENYITKKINFQKVADLIKKHDPDVVGLNEMRGKGELVDYEEQAEILASLTGMEHYYFAKAIDVRGNNPYGNAILSKIPFVSLQNIRIPDPIIKTDGGYYETRCLIKARLANGITVLVTHFGLNLSEQENAVNTVLEHVENEKCILMGDFNVTPTSVVLSPITKVMQDTASFLSEQKFSFPSDNPRVKIDYIFVSKDVKVVSAEIPADIVSDHLPYIAKMDF